jgi:hypothetical protein
MSIIINGYTSIHISGNSNVNIFFHQPGPIHYVSTVAENDKQLSLEERYRQALISVDFLRKKGIPHAQLNMLNGCNTVNELKHRIYQLITEDKKRKSLVLQVPPSVLLGKTKVHFKREKGGEKGFEVEVKFAAKNLRNTPLNVAAYFYYKSGTPLSDFDGIAKTTDGHVAVSQNVTPQSDRASYDNFRLFMPYKQLHMAEDEAHNLAYSVSIWQDSKEVAKSELQNFYLPPKAIYARC